MKHAVASLTIGACLLLSSAGVVFAVDPHKDAAGVKVATGQSGTTGLAGMSKPGVASCPGGGGVGSPPGQVGAVNNSPFTTTKEYAGAGAGNSAVNSPHANSQYDNACFQHMP